MTRLTNKTVWLTGASSGIGEHLALALADAGNRVVISARRAAALDRLMEQRPQQLLALPMDVTDAETVRQAAAKIEQQFGALDILIANAGTCEYVDVKAFDSQLFQRVMNVNYLGQIITLEAALPLLRNSAEPYIVGVSSSAAYFPFPRAQAYGASKAAFTYTLLSMKADLAVEGIDVTVVNPGFVKTPLTDQNDFEMPMIIPVEQAVSAIMRGLERRDTEIHFPKRFTLTMKALSCLPFATQARIARKLSRHNQPSRSTVEES